MTIKQVKIEIMKPENYDGLTDMQKLVAKGMNSHPDDMFIEMVECFDDPEFWEECNIKELSDEECIGILYRLLDMFRDWNCS